MRDHILQRLAIHVSSLREANLDKIVNFRPRLSYKTYQRRKEERGSGGGGGTSPDTQYCNQDY